MYFSSFPLSFLSRSSRSDPISDMVTPCGGAGKGKKDYIMVVIVVVVGAVENVENAKSVDAV